MSLTLETIQLDCRALPWRHPFEPKKLENHIHAMALWFQYDNFARPHMTLTQEKKGIKTTLAMAAGVADHVLKMEEVVGLLSDQ